MQTRLGKPEVKYSYGPYNKHDDKEQWIRITEGCPWNHEYCYETTEIKIFNIPEIIRNHVKIMDMNLLCKPEALDIITKLGNKRVNNRVVNYELVCGIDYRFLTQQIANALKRYRFKNIRIAWDMEYREQHKIKDAIEMLVKAEYKRNDIMIFMICNWRIPPKDNLRKLDLCKVWGVKVADCYFDNQTFPGVNPEHWTDKENKDFRRRCRKHNHLVNFKIDPQPSINVYEKKNSM